MTLDRLRLHGFRNLEDGELRLPADGAAVIAPNAQGKTNLLEAVYYLEIFRSFRGARDANLIRFGRDHFRLEGRVAKDASDGPDGVVIAAAYGKAGSRKKVTVNGREPERLQDAIGKVAAVLFTPDDLALVSGSPEGRRRFLDVVLSLNLPGYVEHLQRYRQVLARRNAALREGASDGAVRAWEPLLVEAGGEVAAARAGWLGGSAEVFRRLYRSVAGGEEAALEYRPSLGEDPGEQDPRAWGDAFRGALEAGREGERRRGVTLQGPHRDEVRIILHPEGRAERDLREFGSGGQRRTAALALRLLEAATVRARRGVAPLLLLDDVFAELDEARGLRLLELLDESAAGQVLITAPKEGDVRFRRERLVRWTLRDGRIET